MLDQSLTPVMEATASISGTASKARDALGCCVFSCPEFSLIGDLFCMYTVPCKQFKKINLLLLVVRL